MHIRLSEMYTFHMEENPVSPTPPKPLLRPVHLALALIAGVLLGVGGFAAYQEFTAPKNCDGGINPIYTDPFSCMEDSDCTSFIAYKACQTLTTPICRNNQCVFPDDTTITITDVDLERGWYWGAADQKKPGTPPDWVHRDAGRSSCWHKPTVTCGAAL